MDSAERAQDHPDTWAHPGTQVLQQIEAGYLVKVGVTHPELSGERFWANRPRIAIQVDQDMRYTNLHGLSDKDILFVTERNVFGIVGKDGMTVWEAK